MGTESKFDTNSFQNSFEMNKTVIFLLAAVIAVQHAYVLESGNYNPEQRLQYIIDSLGDFESDNLVKRADGMLSPAMMSRHFSLLSRYGGVKGGHFDTGRMNGFGKRK